MCIPHCFALSNCSEGTYAMEQINSIFSALTSMLLSRYSSRGKYGMVFKSTRNVEYLHLSSREALCLWIGHVISSENGTQKNQDLFKKLRGYCQ
jgi:hypothetical protein